MRGAAVFALYDVFFDLLQAPAAGRIARSAKNVLYCFTGKGGVLMRRAEKKKRVVLAWQLGAGTAMEEELLREGALQRLADGQYALFSQEAVNGAGEIAQAGDYFKVDTVNGKRYPYPNSREFFEANHRHLEGDSYEQRGRTVAVWQDGDAPCEEMDFLLGSGQLTLCPQDEARYFNAMLLGAPLSAARDAIVLLNRVERDEEGRITDIAFSFISRPDFERDFVLVDTQ